MNTRHPAPGWFLTLALALSGARAQTPLTAPSLPPTATARSLEQAIQEVKQPVSWLKWGGDLRLRNEYFNNAMSLTPQSPLNEQDYFRFRARLWMAITPVSNVTVNARLTTEPRVWMRPASYTPFKGHSGTDWTSGVLDALNVQWREVLGLPATLTVGRQDLLLGDGWLVLEGTPNDGSWTVFLDAARLTWELKEQHTTIDAIGILQHAEEDAWLPGVNSQNRCLGDQDERGAILNVANKSFPAANLDGYFIYKHDSRVTAQGDNADIYTLGGRASGLLAGHWKYSVEGACQFGEKQDLNIKLPAPSPHSRDVSAFGLNSRLAYLFKDRLNNQLGVSYEYLSGDDPRTKNDEMFDILWGRWPRWSELYNVYSYVYETRVGQTANLHRVGPGWCVSPAKNLDFAANYYLLFADQSVPTRTSKPGLFTGSGNFRGHYLQTTLKYRFNAHVSGHLWGELLFPGDFYANRNLMSFLRAELMLTF